MQCMFVYMYTTPNALYTCTVQRFSLLAIESNTMEGSNSNTMEGSNSNTMEGYAHAIVIQLHNARMGIRIIRLAHQLVIP